MTTDDARLLGRPAPAGVRLPLADMIEAALEADPATPLRLRYANTTVCFRVDDEPDACTLVLNADRPRVERGGSGEVEIRFTAAQADAFASGRFLLTTAVSRGDVIVRGPVRQYLEVDPILRGLLSQVSGHESGNREVPALRDSEPTAVIAPELLAIETRELEKAFGSHVVLEDLNLSIPEGAISVVLGPSGTGKSVLLQHVIGLLKPDAGKVLVRGRDVGAMDNSALFALRREIGVMFQDGALLGTMNVYDNTAFPLRQHTDLREREIREVVMDRLATVGLTTAAGRMPNELSGGMRKRAGLARALVMDPGILLCDEPDSGLDPVRTALLAELLRAEHDRMGGTMLVVTHDVRLARRIGDHMSLLWKGRVVASGFAAELLGSDDPFVKQFLAGESVGPLGMD
jgi:phospholipid/cholesterol/gamma-HCH transport system ATP-binding protein